MQSTAFFFPTFFSCISSTNFFCIFFFKPLRLVASHSSLPSPSSLPRTKLFRHDEVAQLMDYHMVHFLEYGTDYVKSKGISPDTFLQVKEG